MTEKKNKVRVLPMKARVFTIRSNREKLILQIKSGEFNYKMLADYWNVKPQAISRLAKRFRSEGLLDEDD